MDIENLTIKQVKEIQSMNCFSEKEVPTNHLLKSAIGKYCIVRSYNEGINAGVVIEADETGVVVEDARRIFYHKPKDSNLSWYEGVAKSGLHSTSKISGPVARKYIIEKYSLTICTEEAEKSIRNHVTQSS